MLNGGTTLVIWPLGGIAWIAAVVLFFQESATADARILELLILGLVTIIGVLLRFAYLNVMKQLHDLQECHKEMRERMAVVETKILEREDR
jgi:hypothetical protein